MTTMDYTETMRAMNVLKVETGSLACLGCEYADNCSVHGCAIIRNAMEHMDDLERALHISEAARSDLARQLAAARKQVDELTRAGLIATDKANQAIADLDVAKADSVPVVRCRDCKYSRPNGKLYECPFFDEIRGDEFCSSGERKEGID